MQVTSMHRLHEIVLYNLHRFSILPMVSIKCAIYASKVWSGRVQPEILQQQKNPLFCHSGCGSSDFEFVI